MAYTPNVTLINGGFTDFEGSPLNLGYLIMQLSHDEQYTTGSNQVVAGLKLKILLDANGNIPASPATKVFANDAMLPSGSFYIVMAYKADGTQAWADEQFLTILSSPSTLDVGTIVPTNPPGGGGSGGSTLLLQVNEVNNGSQSLLDLHAGTNITLTDNGSGRVTIDAASSGGASAPYMLGPGIFDLATGSVNSKYGVWSDVSHQVNVLRFVLLAGISGFTAMDGSFGSNIGGGSTFAAGFYSTAGNLLYSTGSLAIGNVSNVATSYTIPSLTLSPGIYYFAWTCEDNGNLTSWTWDGPAVWSFHSGTSNGNVINQSTINFGVAANPSASGPVLPATLGALTAFGALNAFGVPVVLFH